MNSSARSLDAKLSAVWSGLSLDGVDDEDFDGGLEASACQTLEQRRETLEAELAEAKRIRRQTTPTGRVSFVVDGETYTWPRLPLHDYGDENRRQMDAIRARITAEHEAARVEREANPEREPISRRYGNRCPLCFDDWDVNEERAFLSCCCRMICESCQNRWMASDDCRMACPLCLLPLPKNEAELLANLQRHVDKDVPEAMWQMVEIYRDGKFGLAQSPEEAVKLSERAAELGEVESMMFLGHFFEMLSVELSHPGAAKKADQCYRMAADRGHAKAQNRLGRISFEEKEFGEAVRLFGLAAAQGLAGGQRNLGECHFNGVGVPKNRDEAERLWRLAAAKGDASSQHNLGLLLHMKGKLGEAMGFIGLAAAQGFTEAQYSLAFYHAQGCGGLPPNHAEAKRLLALAAAKGHQGAKETLESAPT